MYLYALMGPHWQGGCAPRCLILSEMFVGFRVHYTLKLSARSLRAPRQSSPESSWVAWHAFDLH